MSKKGEKSFNIKYPNLIMRGAEHIPREDYIYIPRETRGIYALLKKKERKGKRTKSIYNVVRIGLGSESSGIRARISSHTRKWNQSKWSHFSFFEVWPNLPSKWIAEMEALFLHFFERHDRRGTETLNLNIQMKGAKFKKVMFNKNNFKEGFGSVEFKYKIDPKKIKKRVKEKGIG